MPRSWDSVQVYSPHTAVDAVPGGLGDWLADIVTGTVSEPESATVNGSLENTGKTDGGESKLAPPSDDPFDTSFKKHHRRMALQRTYSQPTYPQPTELKQTYLAPSAKRTPPHPKYDD